MRKLWEWIAASVFRLSIFFGVFLLFVTIMLKGAQYHSESRFAMQESFPIHDETILEIVYPTVLEVVPFQESKRQIFISISGYASVKRLQVKIDFSESEGLIFSDSEGNVISSVMVLDTAKSLNGSSVYVRPEPVTDDSQTTASLVVNVRVIQNGQITPINKIYKIDITNPDGVILGYWFKPVLADVGLTLGFAAAILGWAIDYRNRQKEETSKERLSLVQSLREIVKTNPAEAMQRLLEYETEDKKQKWGRPLQSELKTLRALFESRDHLGEMLFSAGEAMERGDYYECEKILSAASEYFVKQDIDIKRVISCLQEKPNIPHTILGDLLRSTLGLWMEYDEYARRIVVHVISHVWKEHKEDQDVVNMIKNSFESIEEYKRTRLLRDPKIRKIITELSSAKKYDWEEISLLFLPSENLDIDRWLNVRGNRLSQNPFKFGSANDLSLIFSPPENWDKIQSTGSTIITSELINDRELLIRFFEFDLQKNSGNSFDVFPVHLTLELTNGQRSLSFSDVMKETTDAIANAWIKLISRNPGAFLNLSRPQQFLLGEFLTAKAGSTHSLEVWLRQWGIEDTLARKMIFKRIKELPDKVIAEAITTEKIYEWIKLKPPDLSQTYMMIDLHPAVGQQIDIENIETLLRVSRTLFRTKTDFKIFTTPIERLSSSENQIRIQWDIESLEKILDSCVNRVSRGIPDLKFSSLFWPENYPYATKRIAKLANSSLSELFRLGNELIQNHIRNDFQNPYLDKSDLKGVK